MDSKIQRIIIIGERHSGTNFISELVRSNLQLRYAFHPLDFFTSIKCDDPWPPKHGYQTLKEPTPGGLSEPYEYNTSLAIVAFRNPWDWVLSMHRDCWCKDKLKHAAKTFEAFLTSRWQDNCPKPWLGETRRGSCRNILECRAYKLQNYLNMTTWAPHVEFVNHERIHSTEGSLSWLKALVTKYNLDVREEGLRPIDHYTSAPPITALRRTYNHEASEKTSVWFNQDQLRYNVTLRQMVALVNKFMVQKEELAAGYSVMELPELESKDVDINDEVHQVAVVAAMAVAEQH
ncbi:hypothetical protein CEUSTIGMA_g3875.t1 [Chlamydomonas eustigma]|uniref:Sulfotransferase n=1 Tax=Chlamydomonas eustigma TaxID=1157962 RepID=A0A250X103_9CHLO|nr:hypothetical protein CEUSTIGMA_g3875.t1 [Chlamydomonas eustigma]|eukprot:GAX76430.1 hypothetical protein CEUSTIGMA_g3875.t1 [Chlamydomonas eustigma]